MNFNFDTASLTKTEAQGIVALLSILFPSTDPPCDAARPVSRTPMPGSLNVSEAGDVEVAEKLSPEAPSPESTPTKGRRRTKAEMAADALLQQGGHAPAGATDPEIATVGATATKPTTADELRALLNGYIQKHSMEDAIAILKEFGCNRVSEALTLEPTKLSELAAKLNA